MGIFDRDYMRRDENAPSGGGAVRLRRLLWIGAAVLAALVIIAAVNTPPDTRPYEKGSRLVNINTATAAELESLPGIGSSLAQLVMAGRPYKDVADLARVKGISERQVEQLRPLLTVSEPGRELHPVSRTERVAGWLRGLTAPSLITYAVVAAGGIAVAFWWLRRMRLRWRNARTRAAFEEAERKRWEGHKRE